MAQLCAQCGTPIKEGHRFCSNCGAAVVDSGPPEVSITPIEPTEREGAYEERVVAPPTLYGPQTPPPPPPPRDAAPSRAATMRPDPREGGMYVPYGTEAQTHIEKTSSSRSRAIPVIIISAILLVGLAAFLLFGQKEEDRVKQVVYTSNEEQIKAWRDLDVEVLRGTRTGAVLAENIAYVEDLKKNLYAVPVLGNLDIKEVKIDGDTATVSTVETWSVTFYNRQDNTVLETKPPQTLDETYHMVKQNGKWLVERLEFDENP